MQGHFWPKICLSILYTRSYRIKITLTLASSMPWTVKVSKSDEERPDDCCRRRHSVEYSKKKDPELEQLVLAQTLLSSRMWHRSFASASRPPLSGTLICSNFFSFSGAGEKFLKTEWSCWWWLQLFLSVKKSDHYGAAGKTPKFVL